MKRRTDMQTMIYPIYKAATLLGKMFCRGRNRNDCIHKYRNNNFAIIRKTKVLLTTNCVLCKINKDNNIHGRYIQISCTAAYILRDL